jgi:hypothetical protein
MGRAGFGLRFLRLVLSIHRCHCPIGVARASDGFVRGDLVDSYKIVAGKCNIERADVFL